MGNFKSKEDKSRVTADDRAVFELKVQRDKISMHAKKMESQADADAQAVTKCLRAGKKDLALLMLKRKKHHEKLVLQSEEYKLQVMQLISNLEVAQVQAKMANALETGNSVLKRMQSEVSIEDIESLLEDTEEARERQEEVARALAGPSSVSADDDDILSELDALMAENVDEMLETADPVPVAPMPAVPVAAPETVTPEIEASSPGKTEPLLA
jgi:charged multivesicular body protein 6